MTSKLPANQNLSKEMIAYLQQIESRRPSDTSTIDSGAALATVIERLNALIQDLNR